MSQETLKTLRIIVPGAMVLIVFLPLTQWDFSLSALTTSLASLEGLLYVAAVSMSGALYYILNLRRYFIEASLAQIQNNIKEHMLRPCLSEPEIAAAADNLRRGRTLLQIFYRFIDNDESLKEKAKSVRLNGPIWSSIADFMAISAVGLALYCGTYILLKRSHYLIIGLILGVGHLVAGRLLMPRVTTKHISLSDEQLEYIRLHHRAELCDRLRRAAVEVMRNAERA